MLIRLFYSGFVQFHNLFHAAQEPIWGVEIVEEFGGNGYFLCPFYKEVSTSTRVSPTFRPG